MALTGAPILSVAQMRAAEQAIFDAGVDPYALMCRAGEGAAELIWRAGTRRDTLVLCGPGNNGGDGYVIARALRAKGVPVRVAALGDPQTDSARRARVDWGEAVEDIMTAAPAAQLVDALFGIGLVRGLAPDLAERLDALVMASGHSYAVDVPSGVESDRAVALSPVPRFTHCLALGAWKAAHMLRPASGFAAHHVLIDIGVEAPVGAARALGRPGFRAPDVDAHKYRRGLVAVLAGEMAGAATLSAEAAARGGAGYVRLISDEAMTDLSHAIVRKAAPDFDKARAVLIGPGLGRDALAFAQLTEALRAGVPLVADADALWLMAEKGMADLPKTAIMTPHEGEFAMLFDAEPGNKIERTRSAAAQAGAVIVHKGPDTVIAAPDGRCAVQRVASTWLSTAGTGDVLAGLCAARLAVTGDPFEAACEAVWLHGEAARRAGAAFIADDLIFHISGALACAL